MDPSLIISVVVALVAMILSLTIHEWAHAYAGYKLGDDTAARQGRLTLNPESHVDPLGTLIVPILGVVMGGFVFGWARPVPYNPNNFTRKVTLRQGTAIIAFAGPLSNLVLAFVCALLLKIIVLAGGTSIWAEATTVRAIGMLLAYGVTLNVLLFLFNLLPIGPLDGHAILTSYLGPSHGLVRFTQEYAMMLFVAAFLLGGRLLGGPMMGIASWILGIFGVTSDAATLLVW